MHLFRLSATVMAAALLAPAAAGAQALPSAELHDLACLTAVTALGAQAAQANKTTEAATARGVGMFFGGKLSQRHPGRKVLPMINENKAALEAALTNFNARACFDEARAALQPAGTQ